MAEKNLKFGRFLEQLIKENKLNKRKTADHIGVAASAIGRYVNEGRVPEAPILEKLADLFNITTKDLLTGKRLKGKPPGHPTIKEIAAIYTEGLPTKERESIEQLIEIYRKAGSDDKKLAQNFINHIHKNLQVKKMT